MSEAQQAADEVRQTVRHVKEVAGATARGALAEHFSDLAEGQRRVANVLRLSVIALLVAVTLLTTWSISLHASAISSWLDLGRRAAVTLPLLALAGYLGRESGHHRRTAEWADAITVQLRTIRAYTDGLPAELRDHIRAEFGNKIFSHGPLLSDQTPRVLENNGIPQMSELTRAAAACILQKEKDPK